MYTTHVEFDVCILNTELKLLPFKQYFVLRQMINGNFNLTPTALIGVYKDSNNK